MEQERADKSKASENEKKHRELQLERQLKEEEKRTRDIISDMTRQYKSMQEELSSKINDLNSQVNLNEQRITELGETLAAEKTKKVEME